MILHPEWELAARGTTQRRNTPLAFEHLQRSYSYKFMEKKEQMAK